MEKQFSQNIQILQYGEGEKVIVMIPGGPGLSYHYLEPLAKDLAEQGFHIYLYEPTGYPNSNPEVLPDSVDYYGRELAQLLDEMNLSNPVLYGHSFGGSIVLEFLAKNPQYTGKVILSNTFPSGNYLKKGIENRFQRFPEEVQQNYKELKAKQDFAGIGQILFTEWLPLHLFRLPELPQELLTSMQQMNEIKVQNHFIGPDFFNIKGVFTDWDVTDSLSEITSDVLCISGEWDYLNETLNLEWMKLLPKSQVIIDQESSHMPFFENRNSYIKTLTDFLKNL
jgi:proline-specific peptidase